MPNWCLNKLTITGPEADVQAFKTKAVGHSPWEEPEGEPDALNFHSLVPIPENLLAAGYDGARYDWEMANWGCKWGASGPGILDEREGHVEYEFYAVLRASQVPLAAGVSAPSGENGPPPHQVIKLGIDVHLDRYVVVRQIDGGVPQPPQRFSPTQFLEWAKKQTALAQQVYSCYEAGPFGYRLHRKLKEWGRGLPDWRRTRCLCWICRGYGRAGIVAWEGWRLGPHSRRKATMAALPS